MKFIFQKLRGDPWETIKLTTKTNSQCTCYPENTMDYQDVLKQFMKETGQNSSFFCDQCDDGEPEETEQTYVLKI